MSETAERGRVVNLSVRLRPEVHRAISIAAARSDKSMNAWLADIAGAGAATANAAALVTEMRELSLGDAEAVKAVVGRALQLIELSVNHAAGNLSELQDVLGKIGAELESIAGAEAIHEEGERG